MIETRWRHYLPAALWFSWAVFVLAGYYGQILRLGASGFSEWLHSQYSLISLWDFWQLAGDLLHGRPWPAFDKALHRALVSIGGAAAVLSSAHILGRISLSAFRLETHSGCERFLYRISCGLGALSFFLLGLSLAGLYTADTICWLLAAGIFAWLVQLVMDLVLKRGFQELIPHHSFSIQMPVEDAIGKAFVIICSIVALTCALAPEIEYDALWYHIGFPKQWLQEGRLVDLPYEYVSLYPMAWELLFGAAMAVGGPVAAKLLHFTCMLLTATLVYQTCRRYLPRCSPWLGTAFFMTIPTVLWEASTAYVDLALTLHLGLAFYALLRYLDHSENGWLLMAGLQLGLSLATKHLAMFGGVILTSGLFFVLWRRGWKPTRAWLPSAAIGLLALLPALPWYWRSWRASGGNPVFPYFFNFLGGPPERWDQATQRGLDAFLNNFGPGDNLIHMLTLPYDLTVHAGRYGGTLGPLFLLLLPSLLFLRSRLSWVVTPLTFFVLVYVALWASPLSSFQMRFLMPITPFAALLAVEAYRRLIACIAPLPGRPAVVAAALITVVLLLNLPPFTSLHENDRMHWDGWLTHVVHRIPINVVLGKVKEEQYLASNVHSYAAWQHINRHLPADAKILTFSGGDHFYSDRNRVWANATIARSAVWERNPVPQDNLLQASQLGITHLLADKKMMKLEAVDQIPIFDPIIVQNYYENEYEDENFALYRIRWEVASGQIN